MTGKLEAINVQKVFPARAGQPRVMAIESLTLNIHENEFAVILGPTGCGKSTFLYMIAGFEAPTSGQILLNGQPIAGPGPDRGIVFQEFALYPWRTVLGNVKSGLEIQRQPRARALAEARKYLGLVGLSEFENAYPFTLSGGMKQRVAIARALAYNPDVLLMDEPFGALDAQTRGYLIGEMERIWSEERKTCVYVTHAIDEAILLADRIFVFSARPAVLRAEVKVTLPRPRDPVSPAFIEYSKELFGYLEHGIRHSMDSRP
ncbi:MAG: ABC transporter ATP-binding protein [Deltaproteobacteria bacterium]|nr:ABC transporter ATP-binding protein [Deltaproteobacteria bacterium]